MVRREDEDEGRGYAIEWGKRNGILRKEEKENKKRFIVVHF